MPNKCLIIGAVMLDISAGLDHLPAPGDDVEIHNQTLMLGGCAYNVSDMMQHFHTEYDLCAPIGKGYYADIIRELLEKSGKRTLISTEHADNGYSLCLIDRSGERTFLTLSGVERLFKEEWFLNIETANYSSAYVCGYQLEDRGGETIVSYLEQHMGWKIFYAPGPRIFTIPNILQKRMFDLHPMLHLNEKEALSYTGCSEYEAAAKQLNAETGNAVIVTLGGTGAYVCENGTGIVIPSLTQNAIDTSGAGDSHIGTIIAALSKGQTLKEAVELANSVAAFVVGVSGPTLTNEQFNEWIKGR